jgi:hypothetical protein
MNRIHGRKCPYYLLSVREKNRRQASLALLDISRYSTVDCMFFTSFVLMYLQNVEIVERSFVRNHLNVPE